MTASATALPGRLHKGGAGHAAGHGGGIGPGHLRAAQEDEIVAGADIAHYWLNRAAQGRLNGQGERAIGAADRN